MLGSWWGTAVAQVDVQLTAEEGFHPFVTEKNLAGYSHLSGNLKDVRGEKKKAEAVHMSCFYKPDSNSWCTGWSSVTDRLPQIL